MTYQCRGHRDKVRVRVIGIATQSQSPPTGPIGSTPNSMKGKDMIITEVMAITCTTPTTIKTTIRIKIRITVSTCTSHMRTTNHKEVLSMTSDIMVPVDLDPVRAPDPVRDRDQDRGPYPPPATSLPGDLIYTGSGNPPPELEEFPSTSCPRFSQRTLEASTMYVRMRILKLLVMICLSLPVLIHLFLSSHFLSNTSEL